MTQVTTQHVTGSSPKTSPNSTLPTQQTAQAPQPLPDSHGVWKCFYVRLLKCNHVHIIVSEKLRVLCLAYFVNGNVCSPSTNDSANWVDFDSWYALEGLPIRRGYMRSSICRMLRPICENFTDKPLQNQMYECVIAQSLQGIYSTSKHIISEVEKKRWTRKLR